MGSVDYWAAAPMQRQQMTLFFSPTLDEMIAADDPVRVVDEVLAGLNWSVWEAECTRGQPPIHPRFVAAAILYGLSRGIRSTRKLEEACCYRLDFLWLVEGRRIDFTTFAKFRTRFGQQLNGMPPSSSGRATSGMIRRRSCRRNWRSSTSGAPTFGLLWRKPACWMRFAARKASTRPRISPKRPWSIWIHG